MLNIFGAKYRAIIFYFWNTYSNTFACICIKNYWYIYYLWHNFELSKFFCTRQSKVFSNFHIFRSRTSLPINNLAQILRHKKLKVTIKDSLFRCSFHDYSNSPFFLGRLFFQPPNFNSPFHYSTSSHRRLFSLCPLLLSFPLDCQSHSYLGQWDNFLAILFRILNHTASLLCNTELFVNVAFYTTCHYIVPDWKTALCTQCFSVARNYISTHRGLCNSVLYEM